jgi:hypothetical protein
LPNRQFDRYKQASLAHQTRTTDRMSLGMPRDPTVDDRAAIDRADAALELAAVELSAARQDYFRDPDAPRRDL